MQAGATQQDQEITNTSSAVEELTVSMKQVSNNAEASAEAARRALDAAEQGNRAVRDTLEGMQRIRASVQATAKKIKSLGDRSLEISEIINVINDITEQTNLLRSEEHTSELQSLTNLVCRLLLEKKKNKTYDNAIINKTNSKR